MSTGACVWCAQSRSVTNTLFSAVAGRDNRRSINRRDNICIRNHISNPILQCWPKRFENRLWVQARRLAAAASSSLPHCVRQAGRRLSSQRRVKKSKRRRRVGRRGSRSCADRLLYVAIDARWVRGASDVNKDGESCASGVRRPLCLTSEHSMQTFFFNLTFHFFLMHFFFFILAKSSRIWIL